MSHVADATIEHSISKADAIPLAKMHRAAFPDFFLSRLGEPFLVQFYLGFVTDPTERKEEKEKEKEGIKRKKK